MSPDEAADEAYVFRRTLAAFRAYRSHTTLRHRTRIAHLRALPPRHAAYLREPYIRKLRETERCINANADLLEEIVASMAIFSQDSAAADHLYAQSNGNSAVPPTTPPTDLDLDKVRSTLSQMVRDWSEEGAAERHACYQPLLDAVSAKYSHPSAAVRVLVPGAGLGRLMLEFARLGFSTQGNEFSFHMLFASDYLLNRLTTTQSRTIHPFIHTYSNQRSDADMLRAIRIPDILAQDSIPNGVDFSMVAGDFVQVYSQPEHAAAWDVVATCFFIDTAHNILEYIDVIHTILKPGGLWVNLGPLTYHFENTPGEASIELSLHDVMLAVRAAGFSVAPSERMVACPYVRDSRSMLAYEYDCVYFEATKGGGSGDTL